MEVAEKISRQKLHRIGSSHQITLMLEDEDSLVNGNSVNRRLVGFSVKLRIVRLVFFENVVDGSQQHPCNSDDRFFVAASFFEIEVASTDFWILFCADSIEGTRL